MSGPPLTGLHWLLAAAPVALLFGAVLTRRLSTGAAATVVLLAAAVIAATGFDAGPAVLAVAAGKGIWLGLWILGVVWPALLLYNVASEGGLERIGRVFAAVLPRRREMLLLLAWVFPSFLQGVAGFGTPIAVSAPLLLASGWGPVRSVAYPLVGYHWSVTFGSMGSSFYMAALTANLGAADQARFAFLASSLLALHCLLAGALVLLLDGGLSALREGWRMLLVVGAAMGSTLVAVAVAVPAVASLAASTAGFVAVLVLSALQRGRARVGVVAGGAGAAAEPAREGMSRMEGLHALAPYLFLLVTALPVFLVPASRAWVSEHLVLAPDFPGTRTGFGWTNAAVEGYTPIAVLGHPGFYVALASLLGYLTYRATGIVGGGPVGVLRRWARSLPQSSVSIILLAVLATIMADAGMVSVLGGGVARVTGGAFPLLAPLVGGLGSFMTGSTTTSNALFAVLQADIARRLGMDAPVLLAAQTVGGNVGNALAPVVALIGLTTVGAPREVAPTLRRCLLPAALLFAVAALVTLVRT